MYNLPYFKTNDATEILDFMKQHAFALITAIDANNKPVATQLPFLIKERNGDIFLHAHVMRNTNHHHAFINNTNVLVVFTSPHCYVSASWYENKQQASTWNYMAVHASGTLQFLGEEALYNMLQELTNQYEDNEASPASFEQLPKEYVERLSKAIVAFEVKVTALEHVFKLSQNKDAVSFANIIQQLNKGNASEQFIANEMKKRKQILFA
ncbi:MAG: FMN-binding negative transcriptional regulator [Chitinophagaceae bacterium]|jgi:transcriptional regulator|nr:FMN-binding negative transcriptional regulator [Chitinophagaceae bacterium]